ncbi:hypothetical protein H0H92_012930 [Tricholoma furcatifolium]|nr:hypothetical protein H0H92_012930 [Tricholoma furcatifolium]
MPSTHFLRLKTLEVMAHKLQTKRLKIKLRLTKGTHQNTVSKRKANVASMSDPENDIPGSGTSSHRQKKAKRTQKPSADSDSEVSVEAVSKLSSSMKTGEQHPRLLQMPVLSRIRLFPTSSPKLTHTPLSILDSAVVRYAPSAGIWIFEKAPSIEGLTESLKVTLDAYPQWSGQLQWASYNPRGGHTERFQRLILSYGTSNDPGVEFIVATSHHATSSFVGDPIEGCTDASKIPFSELLDTSTPLALHDTETYAGLPSLIIQLTTLADGGAAIAIKFAHPLADAITLLNFTQAWAAVSRAVRKGDILPILSPVFDPSMLDHAAAGDIDSPYPSPAILEAAQGLPLHRYDCWNSKTNSPPFFNTLTTAPPEVEHLVDKLGHPITWSDWDYTAPVSYYLVEFSPIELQAMWKDANSVSSVSHLDALLAHIWNLIIRAQQLDGEFHLDMTFGFRNRLDPPLPSTFLGSPLLSAKVTAMAEESTNHGLGFKAASIRSTLDALDAPSLSALLHEMAYEVSPLRRWCAFFGSRNTIITSWLEIGMRDADFGTGVPAHVEAVMPSTDGVVQILEATPNDHTRKRWYECGATVSLHLRDVVMQRLLNDPQLRKYRQ